MWNMTRFWNIFFLISGIENRGVALDPACQEVVSGAVTMVTLEGNAVATQLTKLQDEVSKLKVSCF